MSNNFVCQFLSASSKIHIGSVELIVYSVTNL